MTSLCVTTGSFILESVVHDHHIDKQVRTTVSCWLPAYSPCNAAVTTQLVSHTTLAESCAWLSNGSFDVGSKYQQRLIVDISTVKHMY